MTRNQPKRERRERKRDRLPGKPRQKKNNNYELNTGTSTCDMVRTRLIAIRTREIKQMASLSYSKTVLGELVSTHQCLEYKDVYTMTVCTTPHATQQDVASTYPPTNL